MTKATKGPSIVALSYIFLSLNFNIPDFHQDSQISWTFKGVHWGLQPDRLLSSTKKFAPKLMEHWENVWLRYYCRQMNMSTLVEEAVASCMLQHTYEALDRPFRRLLWLKNLYSNDKYVRDMQGRSMWWTQRSIHTRSTHVSRIWTSCCELTTTRHRKRLSFKWCLVLSAKTDHEQSVNPSYDLFILSRRNQKIKK